jgi:hypothetical protein
MRSDYPLESKGILQLPANPAREMRGFISILFLEALKKGFLRAISAGNAGLAGCFILNARNLFLSSVFPTELGCTPPLFPQIPHPRFFNLNLQIHNL